MARKPTNPSEDKMLSDTQGRALPQTAESGETEPSVRDLPPANPLGEPVKPVEAYPNISEAGKQAAALGIKTEETDGDFPFGETIVEHPVSPTDTTPNPHGQRNQDADNTVMETDKDTKVSRRVRRDEGEVEITGDIDTPVHLGDGRVLAKGQKAKVSKEVAAQLRDAKQAK